MMMAANACNESMLQFEIVSVFCDDEKNDGRRMGSGNQLLVVMLKGEDKINKQTRSDIAREIGELQDRECEML